VAIRSPGDHAFTPTHLELALLFAERAAAAMQRAALSDKIDRYAHDMETLNQVSTSLKASLSSGQIVELVLRALRELLRCDVAAIFLVRERQLVIHAERPVAESLALRVKDYVAEALSTVASTPHMNTAAENSVVLLSDTPSSGDVLDGEIASFLSCPLVTGGQVTGMMHLTSLKPDAFSQDDLRTLSILSSQVATSLQNAELLDRERHKFRDLFNSSLDGIIVVDQDGLIQGFNPALEAVTGWEAEEVVGKARCRDVINCRDESGNSLCEDRCPFQAEAEASPYAEFEITARDGREVLISASCFEIPAAEDEG